MVSSLLFLDPHEHLEAEAPRVRREEILPWRPIHGHMNGIAMTAASNWFHENNVPAIKKTPRDNIRLTLMRKTWTAPITRL